MERYSTETKGKTKNQACVIKSDTYAKKRSVDG